mmetsp:Transcript_49540/g.101124  ORF Transcript_49540/g.101124 Transcript_49540/m.101124 type:complete len:187 (-) Transcript_49540:56-616(-)
MVNHCPCVLCVARPMLDPRNLEIPLSVHLTKPWRSKLVARGVDSDITRCLMDNGHEMYQRMERTMEEDGCFTTFPGVLGVAPQRILCDYCMQAVPQGYPEHWKLQHLAGVTFHGAQAEVGSPCTGLSAEQRAYWRHKLWVQAALFRAMGDVQRRYPRCLQCVITRPAVPISSVAVAAWLQEWTGAS